MHINIIQDATDDHCFGCSEASAIQIVTPVGYVSMRWWTQMFSKLTAQKDELTADIAKLGEQIAELSNAIAEIDAAVAQALPGHAF